MNALRCLSILSLSVIPTAVAAISQSHAEASIETTFSNIVKKERLHVCAASPIQTCNSDFDKPALFAEWLDAEEDRAIAIEKSGDERTAHGVRIQILSYAAMLDIWMDQIRLLHRKNLQSQREPHCGISLSSNVA
jgi:hypothetical protein